MSRDDDRSEEQRAATSIVAAACGVFVAAMVGMAYASVPLYDWFCRTTGFGGTHAGRDRGAAGSRSAARITVRFDANVTGGLPWRFEPEQNSIEVRIGEVVTVNYVGDQSGRARDRGAGVLQRVAADGRGLFLQDQLLLLHRAAAQGLGEKRGDSDLMFFVDPALVKDAEQDGLNTITLSYSLYPVREPAKPVADAARRNEGRTEFGRESA